MFIIEQPRRLAENFAKAFNSNFLFRLLNNHLTLVINELATNSLKYALSEPGARIDIDILESDGKISIIFRDNGPGFPEDIVRGDYSRTGIGFELINGVVRKSLRGTIEFSNEGGAVVVITFNNAQFRNKAVAAV